MAASGLHISISAEKVLSIGGLNISNSMLASLIVSGLLILFALAVRASLKKTNKPTGLQNLAEFLVESLEGMVMGVTNSVEKTALFFPLFATFLLFILFNNWLGLVPGVGTIGHYEVEPETHQAQQVEQSSSEAAPLETAHEGDVTTPEPAAPTAPIFVPLLRAGTADLNTTLAIATISVFMTQVFGFRFLKLSYFSKYVNFSSPLTFFIGLLETVLEFAKIVSFAFRLFGNIFAGEVLLAVIYFLVPLVVPMPFYGLEVVVGAIQALVFAMLSLVFFNMATIGHHEE